MFLDILRKFSPNSISTQYPTKQQPFSNAKVSYYPQDNSIRCKELLLLHFHFTDRKTEAQKRESHSQQISGPGFSLQIFGSDSFTPSTMIPSCVPSKHGQAEMAMTQSNLGQNSAGGTASCSEVFQGESHDRFNDFHLYGCILCKMLEFQLQENLTARRNGRSPQHC